MGIALGRLLFKLRSYLPLPWLFTVFYFADFNKSVFILGSLIGAVGSLIRLWAVSWIGSISRTRSEEHGLLCQRGPYRICRNPLYIGNIFMYLGICIAANQHLMAAFVGIYTFMYYVFIVSYEEDTWTESLEHGAYTLKTPRWIPKGDWKSSFELGELLPALRSERSSLFAWLFSLIFILCKGNIEQ